MSRLDAAQRNYDRELPFDDDLTDEELEEAECNEEFYCFKYEE